MDDEDIWMTFFKGGITNTSYLSIYNALSTHPDLKIIFLINLYFHFNLFSETMTYKSQSDHNHHRQEGDRAHHRRSVFTLRDRERITILLPTEIRIDELPDLMSPLEHLLWGPRVLCVRVSDDAVGYIEERPCDALLLAGEVFGCRDLLQRSEVLPVLNPVTEELQTNRFDRVIENVLVKVLVPLQGREEEPPITVAPRPILPSVPTRDIGVCKRMKTCL